MLWEVFGPDRAGEATCPAMIIASCNSWRWSTIENTVPVGQREVIWSSAQNLTAITDNNARLLIIIAQYTAVPHWHHAHSLMMDALEKHRLNAKDTSACIKKNFHVVNTHTQKKIPLHRHRSFWHDLLWLVSASGSRWPSSATLVIQCPEPLPPLLLLQLHLTALLWSPLHQRYNCLHCFGYRYIQYGGYIDSWSLLHLGCKCYLHLWINE